MGERPLVINASDRSQFDKAVKTRKQIMEQQLDDLRSLLDTEWGRRFIWRLLDHCKIHASVFEPNSKMAYNSGVQDVGHFILGEVMQARPEAYIQMMREHQERNDG